TISVAKAKAGDGLVNVPRINAGANALGNVTVQGDLGEIDCGHGVLNVTAIASLTARSIGKATASIYTAIYPGANGEGTSSIQGRRGKLTIKGVLDTSFISVGAGSDIGSVSIGGSIIGGATANQGKVYAEGNLGGASIGGDIIGDAGNYSGSIGAG